MIRGFVGQYDFLANEYPVEIEYNGVKYKSVEHAFHATKTDRPAEWADFANSLSASEAKRIGRCVGCKPDWDKTSSMVEVVKMKFFRNMDLAEKLLATGNEQLVDSERLNDKQWGLDHGFSDNGLGKILMQVRTEIKELLGR